MKIIKRYIVILLIFILFILGGCSSPKQDVKAGYKVKSGEDITFYITTDVHYLSKDLTDNGEAFKKYTSSGDGRQLDYVDELFNAFTYEVKNKKPDILIISGDLTNNGEKKSHTDFAEKLQTIEENGTSVYVIPGNHDISNPWSRGFKGDKQYITESISNRDFAKIYECFGYQEAISRDKNTLSYLAAPSEDVWLLMLDTNKYKSNFALGYPQADGELTPDTLKWIKEYTALAKEKGANIITVMHHNILNHSDVIRKGYTLNNNTETFNVLKEGNINLILSGHIHVQDISSDKKDTNGFYDIASGSLAVYPHQYGTLKYSYQDASFDYSTSIVNVEGWSKNSGITEKNLNNFKTYSKDYFGGFGYNMAKRQLMMEEIHSDDEIKLMSETMKILNLRYFAGTENLNSKDVINSEGYKLWLNAPYSWHQKYVLSISSDKDTYDNSLKLNIENK
jgi:3',5'-cyclic AMP phosphodiesterase CpdA